MSVRDSLISVLFWVNGSGNVGTGNTDIEMSLRDFSYNTVYSIFCFFEKFNFIIFKSLVCMS